MKKLALLKTLTSVFFYLSVVLMFFTVPFVFIWAIMPERVPFVVNGKPMSEAGIETMILAVFIFISCGFFVYAAYLFKKILELFQKKKIFDDTVIKHLDQTGKAILIGYVIYALSAFFYTTLVENTISLELNVTLDSLFIVGLGLFFIVLSEVFLMAKNIKEENDLTV
jgi:hypothetical protein